ncbi:MAG: AAA family ATPase [Candidatus Kerfeldbacteria bacterium]|nr:AAA family ATPase [Candidatus Kerfeldbacteria bacterium]
MNKLIVIRGPLGVGKTTISKIVAQKLHAEYLSLDEIIDSNNLAGDEGIPFESFLKANEIIFDIASKNSNCFVIDGCFYYQEQIDDL